MYVTQITSFYIHADSKILRQPSQTLANDSLIHKSGIFRNYYALHKWLFEGLKKVLSAQGFVVWMNKQNKLRYFT